MRNLLAGFSETEVSLNWYRVDSYPFIVQELDRPGINVSRANRDTFLIDELSYQDLGVLFMAVLYKNVSTEEAIYQLPNLDGYRFDGIGGANICKLFQKF